MLQLKKSNNSDFFNSKIIASLNRIEIEQVNQRKDLSVINALLKSLIADMGIQKQVDDYFEDKENGDSSTGTE